MLKIVCFNKLNSGGMDNLKSIKYIVKKYNVGNVKTFDRREYFKSFLVEKNDTYVVWMINHYALLLLLYLFFIRIFYNIKIITVQHNMIFHPQTSSLLHNIVSTLIEQIGFFVSNNIGFLSKTIFQKSKRKNKILLSDVMPFDFKKNSCDQTYQKKYDLLYFGRNINYKGLDILYESLIRTKSSLKVVIAGSDVSSLNWSELTDRHQITIIDKYLSDEKLLNFIKSSEFCVYPYRSVTQCGPLVITLSCNGRAIVPNLDYFKRYSSLHNIIYFDAGSIESLTHKLDNLEDLKNSSDKHDSNIDSNNFSWIHLVNKLLSL